LRAKARRHRHSPRGFSTEFARPSVLPTIAGGPKRPMSRGSAGSFSSTGNAIPAEMGGAEVTQFLSALVVDKNVAASTQNQALSAILFLYRDVLEQDLPWLDDIVRSKRRRSSPFVIPAQPRPITVSTLWPSSAAARSSGSCSSRRTRTSQQGRASELQSCDCLVASHGGELAKKLVQGLAPFEVVKQRLYRNPCADEHRRAPKNFGVAADDIAQLGHAVPEYTRQATGRITPASNRRPSAAADAGRWTDEDTCPKKSGLG
jgi:hypothetical protein